MMLKNTFVDDIIGGGQSQQEADKFVKEAEEIGGWNENPEMEDK